MPKQTLKAEFKNFSGGLITEAGELNYPENSFKDGVNFELSKTGLLARRLGMDYEDSPAFITTGKLFSEIEEGDYELLKWEGAGGNPNVDFTVVCIKGTVYIFNPLTSGMSSDGYVTQYVFDLFQAYSKFSLTVVKGSLVVACGNKKVGLLSYDAVANTFSGEYLEIMTRDFWGVPCDVVLEYDSDTSYRGAYDQGHLYNLYNQSWGIPRKNQNNVLINPVTEYKTYYSVYPSDVEQVWTGLQYQASGSDPFERMFPNMYAEVLGSSTTVAKGYFIIPVSDRGAGRNRALYNNYTKYPLIGPPDLELDRDETISGPSVVAEYAGRVFYAGFEGDAVGRTSKTPTLTDHIFFSQLVKNKADFTKCYQEGDPTSRDTADVVDTDGGFIRISGLKKVVSMCTAGSSLVILATNGVWVVSGGNDYGFTATNYKVDRLSVYGVISQGSVVTDGSQVMYWGGEGIFAVSRGQNGWGVNSISESRIQKFYDAIPSVSKQFCTGVYDLLSKKIRWIYNDGDTKELVLDTAIGAFYPLSINNASLSQKVVAAVSLPVFKVNNIEDKILVGTDQVYSLSEEVIVTKSNLISSVSSLRYLVIINDNGICRFSFAYYKQAQFKDWNYSDAAAFINTADFTNNDSSVNKQIPWITTHMKQTEDSVTNGVLDSQSSCYMSTKWDWSVSSGSNKWSREQQIYRLRQHSLPALPTGEYSYNFRLVTTKNKIRGIGKAVSVLFRTEPLKDCQIVGWSIALNGNSIV